MRLHCSWPMVPSGCGIFPHATGRLAGLAHTAVASRLPGTLAAITCHGLPLLQRQPSAPPRDDDQGIHQLQLPDALLHTAVPTHILWGRQDKALLPELLNGLERWVPHLSLTYAPDASHWLVHERPDLVIRQLHQILRQSLPKESYQRLTALAKTLISPLIIDTSDACPSGRVLKRLCTQ